MFKRLRDIWLGIKIACGFVYCHKKYVEYTGERPEQTLIINGVEIVRYEGQQEYDADHR